VAAAMKGVEGVGVRPYHIQPDLAAVRALFPPAGTEYIN
jgi:hypothetical protein